MLITLVCSDTARPLSYGLDVKNRRKNSVGGCSGGDALNRRMRAELKVGFFT